MTYCVVLLDETKIYLEFAHGIKASLLRSDIIFLAAGFFPMQITSVIFWRH